MILSMHMYVYIIGYMRVVCVYICVCVYARVAIYLDAVIFVYPEASPLSPARGSGAGGWCLVVDGSLPVAGSLWLMAWGLGRGGWWTVVGGFRVSSESNGPRRFHDLLMG